MACITALILTIFLTMHDFFPCLVARILIFTIAFFPNQCPQVQSHIAVYATLFQSNFGYMLCCLLATEKCWCFPSSVNNWGYIEQKYVYFSKSVFKFHKLLLTRTWTFGLPENMPIFYLWSMSWHSWRFS